MDREKEAVRETVEDRSFVRKVAAGCFAVLSVGDIRSAALITTPCLPESAILSTGSTAKCLAVSSQVCRDHLIN